MATSTSSAPIDEAILVISAPDGPMPTTRDDLALAQKIGVKTIKVYMANSGDVDDEELLELVELEIRELLSSYGFDGDDASVSQSDAISDTGLYDTNNQLIVDPCSLPKDPGPCKAAIPKLFYNSNKGRCQQFTYGGCGGNGNRFDTRKACKTACVQPSVDDLQPVLSTPESLTIEISQPVLNGIIGLVMVLLIINISCLSYFNCVKSKKGNRKIVKYSKVDVIASSDDDMQNLK